MRPPPPPPPPARALRNVWLWLSNVGDVCNREMGTPFHRCLRLFSDAKDNCERALSFLFFLCYIIITFKPLCGLASSACTPPSVSMWGRRGGHSGDPPPPPNLPPPRGDPWLPVVGLLFCIIPMYIQSFLRRVVAERE